MKKKIQKLRDFINNELWSVDIDKAPKPKKILVNFLRLFFLGLQSFKEDKLNVRASALTYFSLLSIVPVLALAFGIAKGFGLDDMLEREIAKSMSGQREVLNYILTFTKSMLGTARGGLIAGLGFVLLIWSVINLLSNIESSFNTVWDVKKSRTIVRKFTDYLTIILLGPILIILAGSLTVFISSSISDVTNSSLFGFVTPVFLRLAKIIPFIIVWVGFTLLYLVMPNTKVNFKSALIAGILAGTVFQIFQSLYISFQAGATRINAIYGSFAALPLFLIWLQTSWFIVLIGAEISFVIQNVKIKGESKQIKKLSISYQKKLALFIVKVLIDYFSEAKPAPTVQQIASKTTAPVYTVAFILDNLVDSGVVSKVIKEKNITFQPAMSAENLTINKVLSSYETKGDNPSLYIKNKMFKRIEEKYNELNKFIDNSEKNILLSDIKINY
ncbi:MAG: YihY/virulence factor BrkB family protein [Chlorobi bacterium]|nr:YihY/virulence factor BrkB family protein [Chlorobiota bacterium]